MTTQPETAVGSVAEAAAPEPTLEDRFAAHANAFEEPQEEEQPEEGVEPETGDDVTDEELEALEGGDPAPIKAPSSWTAEEQAAFAELPRHMQETVTRREAEREKFVQAKSQEAARVKAEAETKALAEVQQIAQTFAQQFQATLPQIPEKPNAWLQVNDPVAYAEQMDAHEWAVAQHQYVQQQINHVSSIAQAAAQESKNRFVQEAVSVLSEQFPEYLAPDTGNQIRSELEALATGLGFKAEDLPNFGAREILALRTVSELKAKAEKYDKLMASRMENVRKGKQLPRVSRPGQPQPQGAVSAKRLESDRNAMRGGDMDAAKRVFARHLA